MLLCLIVTKPLLLQFSACIVSYIASLDSALFKEKPHCSTEITLIQDDEPGCPALSIAFFLCASSFWLVVSIFFSFSKTSLSFFFEYLISSTILIFRSSPSRDPYQRKNTFIIIQVKS